MVQPAGPAVTVVHVAGAAVPQLKGEAAADTTLRTYAGGFGPGCQVSATLDTYALASFRWICGTKVTGAALSLPSGRLLTLADLFTGGYASYLSSTASMQLQAEGATDLATTDLSAWTLAPGALEVTFPGGTVSYPLSSLSHYIRHPGPLSP